MNIHALSTSYSDPRPFVSPTPRRVPTIDRAARTVLIPIHQTDKYATLDLSVFDALVNTGLYAMDRAVLSTLRRDDPTQCVRVFHTNRSGSVPLFSLVSEGTQRTQVRYVNGDNTDCRLANLLVRHAPGYDEGDAA